MSRPLPAPIGSPSAADLDAAELAAYVALHRVGLCRWQAIEVLRVPGRAIRITGVVENFDQVAALKTALDGVHPVEFEVIAPPADLPALSAGEPGRLRLEPRPTLIEKRIEEYFLRRSPREQTARSVAEFCGRATQLSATTHTEAQALSTLAAAFPDARLQRMSAADRSRFAPLAEEHMREVEQSLAQLGVLLDRLDGGRTVTEPAPALPGRWEEWCRRLYPRVARMDYLVAGLFAGLDLRGLTADQAWLELREAQGLSLALLDATGPSLRSSLETRSAAR
ncbi:MAG: hypothetical protein M1541_05595 [Acidobacteria bacterium]|nr:hypothetical protein [Acidobacteriota bacterium]